MKQQKTMWNKVHQPHWLEAEDYTKQPTWHILKNIKKQSEQSSGEQNELKSNWNLLHPLLIHSQQRERFARRFSTWTIQKNLNGIKKSRRYLLLKKKLKQLQQPDRNYKQRNYTVNQVEQPNTTHRTETGPK